MRTFDIFAYLIGGPVLAWSLYHWIREIRFYRRNDWNWDLDSGAPKMHYGDEGYIGEEMSPRARVYFGYPLFIGISVVFIVVAIFQVPVNGF